LRLPSVVPPTFRSTTARLTPSGKQQTPVLALRVGR